MSKAPRILHLGLGAFFRSHLSWYLHKLRSDQPSCAWTIVAGNLRRDNEAVAEALSGQGGSFTLETVSPEGERKHERITSISKVVLFEADLDELAQVASSPTVQIISMTVTEGGYYSMPEGGLDLRHPDIQADLNANGKPHDAWTIYGALQLLLSRRLASGRPLPVLLSCDNLRHNGQVLRCGLQDYLKAAGDKKLLAALDGLIAPCSMVDRITPKPAKELFDRVREAGLECQAPVMAESFAQWVVETFPAPRPEFELVGVQFVDDVAPFEDAKLRLLNATHSCLAWGGALDGYRFVHECARDSRLVAAARQYVQLSVEPCLRHGPVQVDEYHNLVLDRFRNAALGDTVERILSGSHAKVRQFLLPTLERCIADGHSVDGLANPAAFLHALIKRWVAGDLKLRLDDDHASLSEFRRIGNSVDSLRSFAESESLWGSAAGNHVWYEALRAAATELDSADVFVVGNACVDIYVKGQKWPGPGERAFGDGDAFAGGNGINIAAAVAALRVRTTLATSLGWSSHQAVELDSMGKRLMRDFYDCAGDVAGDIVYNMAPPICEDTGRTYIVVHGKKDVMGVDGVGSGKLVGHNPVNSSYLVISEAANYITPQALSEALAQRPTLGYRIVTVSLGVLPKMDSMDGMRGLLDIIHRSGPCVRWLLDTTLQQFFDEVWSLSMIQLLRSVDIFAANADELAQLAGLRQDGRQKNWKIPNDNDLRRLIDGGAPSRWGSDSLGRVVQKIVSILGVKSPRSGSGPDSLHMLIKCGEEGVVACKLRWSVGSLVELERIPAVKVKVEDTTGAGDAFAAGVVSELSKRGSRPWDWASVVAACKVGVVSASRCIGLQGPIEYLRVGRKQP